MLKRMLGYVKGYDFFGEVVGIDFTNERFTLKFEEENREFSFSEVEILSEAFEFHDIIVFNKDVLGDALGNMYMVELHDNGEVTFHTLNKYLEIIKSGSKFKMTGTIKEDLEEVLDFVGNFYELRASLPKKPEFNIQIVKDFNGKHYTYYYACNNKKEEQIDLVKVIFVGSTILEEEEHQRITISHEQYMESISSDIYIEVSPQELQNYVTGLLYGKKEEVVEEEESTPITCGVNCQCIDFCDEKEGATVGDDAPVAPEKCPTCKRESGCYCKLWN